MRLCLNCASLPPGSRWVVLATVGGVVVIYFFSLWAGVIG